MVKAGRAGGVYAVKALIDREEPDAGALSFQLESEILKRITSPRVPKFVEAFTLDGVRYIVQEFNPGLPLSYWIDAGRRFREAEVKNIVRQLLAILHELHCPPKMKDAVVHRDLRLSNILLKDGQLCLIDFGFARFLDPSQNPHCPDPLDEKFGSGVSGGAVWSRQRQEMSSGKKIPGAGTYRLLRREISPRSDLFGAGVVAVDLFTNWVDDESLFARPWREVLPLSDLFADFLQKLLSRDNGFTTAAEALEQMKTLM